MLVIVFGSLLRFFGRFNLKTFERLTLQNYVDVFRYPNVIEAFINSLLLAIVGGIVCILLAAVVAFLRDATLAVGRSTEGITGHSARVTGAQRMAQAGHPVSLIQLFGRWGSPAVMQYVREAALGSRGGQIARVTESLGGSMAMIEEQVAQRVVPILVELILQVPTLRVPTFVVPN